jgi:deoxyribodipyrimidine photo-lyase
MTALVWFRKDLRLSDNLALSYACNNHKNILPLYIYDEKLNIGGAQKVWLHHSLQQINKSLGEKLIFKKGNPETVLIELITKHNIEAVYWNRCYTPYEIQRDAQIKKTLKNQSIEVKSFDGYLLFEPHKIKNKQGNFFKVFTPFYKTCLEQPDPRDTINKPKVISCIATSSDNLKDWKLLPINPDWSKDIVKEWTPGEDGAKKRLIDFFNTRIHKYEKGRDFPGNDLTSMLSPHIHFGEISPHQVWHKARQASAPQKEINKFISELCWREFSYHLLFYFP